MLIVLLIFTAWLATGMFATRRDYAIQSFRHDQRRLESNSRFRQLEKSFAGGRGHDKYCNMTYGYKYCDCSSQSRYEEYIGMKGREPEVRYAMIPFWPLYGADTWLKSGSVKAEKTKGLESDMQALKKDIARLEKENRILP